MRFADFYECDICNGNQVGMSLFVQGCPFHCKGCFNKETWNYDGGKEWTAKREKKFLSLVSRDYIKRVSFLGGSPLCDANVKDVCELIEKIRKEYPDKKIWVYTGLTWEEIMQDTNEYRKIVIENIDYLVDGRFDCTKKDVTLAFKGSENQRIIDVQRSLKEKKIVLWE